MFDRQLLLGFAIRFTILFAVLTLPWPGFRGAFCSIFQLESRWLLNLAGFSGDVVVEKNVDPARPSVDTRILLADPKQIGSDNAIQSKSAVVLDSRSLGWMPNAMMIALLGATPAAWSYRRNALVVGLLVVNAFVAASVLVAVWHAIFDESSPGWRSRFCLYANHLLIENLWVSFVFPILIWSGCLVLAFHRGYLRLSTPDASIPRR